MDDVDLAYFAGCIDSDGCISVARSPVSNYDTHTFHECVVLGQVIPVVPYMLLERFGGAVNLRKTKAHTHRDLFVWTAKALKANRMLVDILPYLHIKREQALNCIELRRVMDASKRHYKRRLRYTRQMERLHRVSRALNRRGTLDGEAV